MILIGYRHGLRASELCALQWVAGRAGHRPATRPQGEERLAECPPDAGRRNTRAATSAARTGAVLARLYDRAGRADDAQGLPCAILSDRGSGQDAIPDTSAHAAAWLRLRPSQRRPRHTGATGLARAQEHPAHGALHRTCAGQVQELLAIGVRGDRRDVGRGRSRSAYPPVQNEFTGVCSSQLRFGTQDPILTGSWPTSKTIGIAWPWQPISCAVAWL